MPNSDQCLASLKPFFEPRSVAIIGASSNPGKPGGFPIAQMLKRGFAGDIYPVNPKQPDVQGLKAYASLSDISAPIDLAICALPGKLALEVTQQCAATGVKALVMFSAGFGEVDDAGAALQAQILSAANNANMRLLGPNSLGVVNMTNGSIASFAPSIAMAGKGAGNIGIVTQSGAFGNIANILLADQGLQLSKMMATGNEADVQTAEGLLYLAEDPATDVIMLYLEGCADGPLLIEGLKRARANKKPVVAIKVGRSEIGAQAVASHTGALAGADQVFDAVLRQFGAYRADSMEEFIQIGAAASMGALPQNDQIGIVTVSGGVGIMMADDAEARGLDVAPMPQYAQDKIKELVPFAGTRNPLDMTAQVGTDHSLLGKSMDVILGDGSYGAVTGFFGALLRMPKAMEATVSAWQDIKNRFPDTYLSVAGPCTKEARAALAKIGIPTFEEPTHATRAAAAMARFATSFMLPVSEIDLAPFVRNWPEGGIGEHAGLEMLREAGVPAIEARISRDENEAAAQAHDIGFPVVLKISSAEIVHKTELDGVRLNLNNADEVRQAFREVIAAVQENAPNAPLEGCLVAPMVSGGVETIIGMTNDPVFGPVIMFGLGGVFVEVLEDVTFRAAPFDEVEALRMIDDIKGRKLLDGQRGARPSDIKALACALSNLSKLCAANASELLSIEANPFLVMPENQGALALDSVILKQPSK
jgi:acyl-CoA synthetase (NDP forming)